MKRILPLLLSVLLLFGCSAPAAQPVATEAAPASPTTSPEPVVIPETSEIPYESRFRKETLIQLSDTGMDISGPNSLTVFASMTSSITKTRRLTKAATPTVRAKTLTSTPLKRPKTTMW